MVQLNRFNITNLYLYGTLSTPVNLVSQELIRPEGAVTSVNVEARDYMATAGRFAIPSQFELIQRFFENNSIPPKLDANGNITFYTKLELKNLIAPDLSFFGWSMKQFNYADATNDFLDRVWVYNSSGYKISDDAKFFIDANGNRWIEDLAIVPEPASEDFDFETGSVFSFTAIANSVVLPSIDPSGIGRKVLINYVNPDLVPRDNRYTQSEFLADRQRSQSWRINDGPLRIVQLADSFVSELFNSGVTKFLDGNKPILYGSPVGNRIDADAKFFNTPTLTPFQNNGVFLIGGAGNDTLIGISTGANTLFGNEGNDLLTGKNAGDLLLGTTFTLPSDTLEGGRGNDTLRGSSAPQDAAVFSDVFANYDIASGYDFFTGGQFTTISHTRGTQIDGIDRLSGIDFAIFSDITIELGLNYITGSQTINGNLSNTDLRNPDRQGRFTDDYFLINVSAGELVNVYLTSTNAEIDPYLQIVNADTGATIAFNDDGGLGVNSQLSFTVGMDTQYIIRATSYSSNDTGAYTLSTSTSPFSVNGSLTSTDLNNPNRFNTFADEYLLREVIAGQPVQLNLDSPDGIGYFDPYLQLFDANTRRLIDFNDDGGIGLNSELNFIVEPGIDYLVQVTSYRQQATGDYILTTNFGTLS